MLNVMFFSTLKMGVVTNYYRSKPNHYSLFSSLYF